MSNSLTGNLLVSTTKLDQTSLARTVCLVLHHDNEKVVGVVLNRPLHPDSPTGQVPSLLSKGIHFGGPNAGPLFAVHDCESFADATTETGVCLSTTKQHVEQAVESADCHCRLIVGNVQWASEELQAQAASGCWSLMPADDDVIFSGDDEMWELVSRKAFSRQLAHWVGAKHIPPHPAMN